MAQHITQGATTVAPAFDAPTWFAAWSDNGGIAMLVHGSLFIGRIRPLDQRAAQRLDMLRWQIVRKGSRLG